MFLSGWCFLIESPRSRVRCRTPNLQFFHIYNWYTRNNLKKHSDNVPSAISHFVPENPSGQTHVTATSPICLFRENQWFNSFNVSFKYVPEVHNNYGIKHVTYLQTPPFWQNESFWECPHNGPEPQSSPWKPSKQEQEYLLGKKDMSFNWNIILGICN